MRRLFFLYTCIIIESCTAQTDPGSNAVDGKERYRASTPANNQVKAFLNIPLTDSVDFIRWDLTFDDIHYDLSCQYGLSKPNTRGFINGGHSIKIKDKWTKSGNDRLLKNGSSAIKLTTLNATLLHFVDEADALMTGNGGWSYTLNNDSDTISDVMLVRQSSEMLKDSTKYEGRSPAGVPGLPDEPVYNKLKWQIVLYADAQTNTPTSYRAIFSPWRNNGPKTGHWKKINDAQGRITYQLLNDDKTIFVSLMKPDNNILLLTDRNGKLLVGNEDFSYTLNKYF